MPREIDPDILQGVYGGTIPGAAQAPASPQAPTTQANFYEQYLTERGWNPGAGQAYGRLQQVDPRTGQLSMPGLVPADQALRVQALHEQGVYNYRQDLMRGASEYLRGALGHLQSFRPGGAAALESGLYGQMAQTNLARAQLTEPMDLTADYQRHAAHQARKAAKKAATAQMAVQIAGIGASLISGGAAAGTLAPTIAGGLSGAIAGTNAAGQQGGAGQPRIASSVAEPSQPAQATIAQPGAVQGPQGATQPAQNAVPVQANPIQSAGAPPVQGAAMQTDANGNQVPAQTSGGAGFGGGGGAGGGMHRDAQGRPVAQPQQRQAGGGGGAMAQSSPYGAMPSPAQQLQQMALMSMMLQDMESDPVFSSIDRAIEREAAYRS